MRMLIKLLLSIDLISMALTMVLAWLGNWYTLTAVLICGLLALPAVLFALILLWI